MSKRALIVVREVSGVAALGRRLVEEFGYELLGNAAAVEALLAKGIECAEVAESDAARLVDDAESGISLVVANYMSVQLAGRDKLSWKGALAGFDRAIVDCVRSAAWAASRVAVLGSAEDYEAALEELAAKGGKLSQQFRVERATAALRAASEFDFAVAQYLEIHGAEAPDIAALSGYPKGMRLAWVRGQSFSEGENRHQHAALYGSFFEHFRSVSGGDLDYSDVLSVSRAAYLIGEFERGAAVLLANGKLLAAGMGSDASAEALRLLGELGESQGVWLAVNGSVGDALVAAVKERRLRGILAPDYSEAECREVADTENLKVVSSISGLGYEELQEMRSVVGGALVQDKDRTGINPMEWTVASFAQPLVDDWEPLVFGAKLARHVGSFGCVALKDGALLGFEYGRAMQTEAWEGLRGSVEGMDGALVVFDDSIRDGELLRNVKAAGARLVLCPFGEGMDALGALANELGLVLMTMPRTMRRF